VYLVRKQVPLRAGVELTYPVSAVLEGSFSDTPDLAYVLGQALAAAMPQNALLLGLPGILARRVWVATLGAFGPPELGRRVDAAAARLAESFWQIIPARTQRRLQELLGAATVAEYEDLVARAHQAGRRVGLFLSGDFASAARSLLVEIGLVESPSLSSLRGLCEEVPALADLLRLAVSPEFASARWHVVAPTAPRGTSSSGRFSLF